MSCLKSLKIMMTTEEAFKKMGLRYYGPNVKARIIEVMQEYAREQCEKVREECGRIASRYSENASFEINSCELPKLE